MRKTNLTALTCIVATFLGTSARAVCAQDYTAQNFATQAKLAPGAKVILVDDDRQQFRSAPYSYINNAIYAANPGDVIRVAPGLYREAVVINKNVRLEGAQAGRSASQGKRLASPSQESIIVMGPNLLLLFPLSNTVMTVRAAGAVIDGFSVQGEGTSQLRVGVGVDTNIPSFSLLNTRIENATVGLSLTNQTYALIQGNAFLNNQNYANFDTGAFQSGFGIAGASPLSNVAILSNVFAGNQETGIALGSPPLPPKEGEEATIGGHIFNINISSNRFDASLVSNPSGANIVLQNAEAITLKKNTIRGGSGVGFALDSSVAQAGAATTISQNTISGVAGDGMLMRNSLLSAVIDRNTVSNNGGNGIVLSEIGTYVNAFNLFRNNKIADNGEAGFRVYASLGNHLENNTISGNGSGIVVDFSQDNQFRNNVVRNSVVHGIFANDFSSGNVFTNNQIQGSGRFDIEDISVGDGTAGTDDIYRNNSAKTANPAALATAK